MKRKEYETPTMQVVECRQQTQLLTGSITSAGVEVTLEEEDWVITSSRGLDDLPDELLLP